MTIPVARPSVGDAEIAAAAATLRSGWLTQGPEVAAFERDFAAWVGAEHACAVSSCTAALHLALLAVGTAPGDEVVTVSHSFIASANSVRYCGAIPVFVDIQPGTYNINPALVEAVITERTRAILAVHQMGMPCDLPAILDIARRHSLPVVEDAACAIGSEIRGPNGWEQIGKPHADVACFSFHPRKLLTTGDGGMITTSWSELDAQVRLWRQHGMSVPDTVRHSAARVTFESYVALGFNYRLTDLQAAVGRAQLVRLPAMLQRRRHLAQRYQTRLSAVPGLRLPVEPDWARSNWQSYCVGLPDGCNQRTVMQSLLDAGIATRRGIMCAHREPAYPRDAWSCGTPPGACRCSPAICERLQESERAQDHSILLPLFDEMTEADQDSVIACLAHASTVGLSKAGVDQPTTPHQP